MQQNSHTDVIFLVILLFASNSLLHVACEGLGTSGAFKVDFLCLYLSGTG